MSLGIPVTLWYMTSVDISPSESSLRGGRPPVLTIQSAGHAPHVFINGQLSGSAHGNRENRRFTFTSDVNMRAGINRIALLSIAGGLLDTSLERGKPNQRSLANTQALVLY